MQDWLSVKPPQPCSAYYQLALERQQQLTKPAGALGRLEAMAIKLAALQQSETPEVKRISISVFAADHGIAAESVSAYPQSVTAEMVRNFLNGGAAINVLSKQVNAELEIIDIGVLETINDPRLIQAKIAPGTKNFLQHQAMSKTQLQQALEIGKAAVTRRLEQECQLFIGGEMGIANTTSASALACALLSQEPHLLTGAGTGMNSQGIEHKCRIIDQALRHHRAALSSPFEILQTLGGFEIAALCGAFLAAAQSRLPVLIDGFIASVAALWVSTLQPNAGQWFIAAHCSQELGHRAVLKALDLQPLLDLELRLGEASGAALAVPVLQSACALHNNMATFAQAQVATKISQ